MRNKRFHNGILMYLCPLFIFCLPHYPLPSFPSLWPSVLPPVINPFSAFLLEELLAFEATEVGALLQLWITLPTSLETTRKGSLSFALGIWITVGKGGNCRTLMSPVKGKLLSRVDCEPPLEFRCRHGHTQGYSLKELIQTGLSIINQELHPPLPFDSPAGMQRNCKEYFYTKCLTLPSRFQP